MNQFAGNRAIQPAETYHHQRLKAAITAQDWVMASDACDRLRLHGWRYSRFAEEFGAAEWESYSQAMDAADSDGSDDE